MCNSEQNKPGAFPYGALYMDKMIMLLFLFESCQKENLASVLEDQVILFFLSSETFSPVRGLHVSWPVHSDPA